MQQVNKPRVRVLGRGEPVTIGEGYVKEITDKAILVVLRTGRNVWVPMNCIHDDSELYGIDELKKRQPIGTEGALILKRFWAVEKGFCRP